MNPNIKPLLMSAKLKEHITSVLKEHITSVLDIKIESIDEDTEFIILASDGLWKVRILPYFFVHWSQYY